MEKLQSFSSSNESSADEAIATKSAHHSAVAIIGMAGRFPGANNLDEFWENLKQGVESVTHFTDDELLAEGIDPELLSQPNYVKANAILTDIDQFDAAFFGYSDREASLMDPQQRIFLECAWEAIESAGYATDSYGGSVGVYAGTGLSGYLLTNLYSHLSITDVQHFPTRWPIRFPNAHDCLPTRVAYKLNLRGPAVNVQTACSTSLVAIHMACQSVLNDECDMALAGGVFVRVPNRIGYLHQPGMIFSPDGHCRSFDAKAEGTLYGDGVGIVVLKRLSEALADGDCIHAVIRSSAINNDGSDKVSFTAPSVTGQADVVARAQDAADIDPETITYIEAHGTGTALGDPIELSGLTEVFRRKTEKTNFCALGSVKTNIGHLVFASGVAGLIKTTLALKHQQIPPSLHFEQPNPKIDFASSPFYVNTQLTDWKTNGIPRRAGVNSFGVGGTNAHVILEEAPQVGRELEAESSSDRPTHLLTLSGKSENALRELAQRYQAFLTDAPTVNLANVCFTANTGRTHFEHRLAIATDSVADLQEQIAAFVDGHDTPGLVKGAIASNPAKIAFLFTGQGSQYVNMGRQLYETQPTFRATLDRCAQILQSYLPVPLLDLLYPSDTAPTPNSQQPSLTPLDETAYTQPALFALEYALATLWQSWGIQPDAVAGHSVGEYVAACLAGVFSLEDGLKLIAERGRLMQALPRDGGMLSILATETQVLEVIQPYGAEVAIAAINGPQSIVISGRDRAIAEISAVLEAQGIKVKPLQVSHAFHSPLMEPMLAEFEQVAQTVTYAEPTTPLISNVTGQAITAEVATPEYWCRHIRQAVRFADGMKTLHQQGYTVFLEIGPKPILLGMGRQCIADAMEDGSTPLWLPSLRPGQTDWEQLLQSLSHLYVHGMRVNWSGFDQDYRRHRMNLPTYPWQRQRYWIDPIPQADSTTSMPALPNSNYGFLGQRLRLPFSSDIRFESHMGRGIPTYLSDHKLYGTVVVAAASHISMMLTAVRESFKTDACEIKELYIPQPLMLADDEQRIVQLVLSPQSDETSVQLVSLKPDADPNDTDAWMLNATGYVRHSNQIQGSTPTPVNRTTFQQRCDRTLPGDDFYTLFANFGYNWEGSFRWIDTIWHKDGEALAQLKLPASVDEIASGYQLYPGIIDACFQLLSVCWLEEKTAGDAIYVPFQIHEFRFYKRPDRLDQLWCYARRREKEGTNAQSLLGDITLFDESGEVIAEIVGHESRKAKRSALQQQLQRQTKDLLYTFAWQAVEGDRALSSSPSAMGNWLIFTDTAGTGHQLSDQLQQYGGSCVLVSPGLEYKKVGDRHYHINPSNPEDVQKLLAEITENGQMPYHGVVHLWSLQSSKPNSLEALQSAQKLSCGSVLHLVQAVVQREWPELPRLWLVTQGSQPVQPNDEKLQVQQAPLWGLGRVIAMEHPELRCTCLDLSPAEQNGEQTLLDELLHELMQPDAETQVAYRQGVRHVARLVQRAAPSEPSSPEPASNDPVQLRLTEYGSLDNLSLQPVQRDVSKAGEVEIQVCATGLNFRDVLNALGMLKEYYATHLGISSAAEMTFGFECAGTIAAVGEGVTEYQVGDEVMAVMRVHNAIGSFVTVPTEFVVLKPERLSFAEAATVPLAFLTAYYGLHHLAQLKPGERILIHAAAGGVGQAAVQLAQQAGAEVFATASPGKWDFLKSMGVTHVMNSRTLEFAEQILELTNGQGVDVVFNSLNGEFITKSFDVLAPHGRFIEIGKLGIWDDRQVQQYRPDVAYFPFDLGDVRRGNPALVPTMFSALAQSLQQGDLQPLPHKVFPAADVVNAFRYMAGAKHIGKIVIDMGGQANREVNHKTPGSIQPDRTYLITGGLGALGLAVAQWLVEQGAQHLILMGRRDPNEAAQHAIAQLQEAGASVTLAQADVASPADVANLLEQIAANGIPLGGIIHAAGILDDGMLVQQTWERFTQVMAAKIAGTWNLHTLTQSLPLDLFVCFSSVTALLGTRGQSNYAAANAFMDALMHQRRQLGLPGLSINWGSWADAGMAANLDSRLQQRRQARGVGMIPPELGLYIMGEMLRQQAVQVGVFDYDWSKFLQQFSADRCPSLFRELARQVQEKQTATQRPVSKQDLLQTLHNMPEGDRYPLLLTFMQEQVAKVLGLKAAQLDVERSLVQMGLDSLTSIELRNLVKTHLCLDVPAVKFMEGSNTVTLVTYLAEQLVLPTASSNSSESTAGSTVNEQHSNQPSVNSDVQLDDSEKLLTQLDQLSDADVDALLNSMLPNA
jgi:malonyl CoA-acyl carrier protein transacylase